MLLSKKLNSENWIKDLHSKFIELNSKFNNSFKQKEHLFSTIPPEIIHKDFQNSLLSILSISPEKISVGVSDDECVYIYFEKDGRSVYFDLFFEPQQATEASVTVFKDKISQFSFTDYLYNSLEKTKNEFFRGNEVSYPTFAEI